MTSEVPEDKRVRVAVPKLCGGASFNGEAEGAGRAEVYSSWPPRCANRLTHRKKLRKRETND